MKSVGEKQPDQIEKHPKEKEIKDKSEHGVPRSLVVSILNFDSTICQVSENRKQ